jgi:transcriptional regulator with XRE-family HTH domain
MIYDDLRARRIAQGLTLEELAGLTGIAASNLSRLEQGRVDARLSTIGRVLLGLGLTLALVPANPKSLIEVRDRMSEGAVRLAAAGLGARDVMARLAWKEERGLDTTVERRVVGETDGRR